MNGILKYHGLTILWALFIFIMCSINLGSIDKSPMFFAGFDKLVHCGFFFTLMVLYCNGVIRQQNKRLLTYKKAIAILALCVFYGALIEVLQLEVFTWRSADWSDLFCDALGACMGVFGVMVTGNALSNEKK